MRHVIKNSGDGMVTEIGQALRDALPGDTIVVPDSYAEMLATVGRMQIGIINPAKGAELETVKIVVEAP